MVNYVKVTIRKTFQNKIFPELNSKKHTPSPTVWFLRNCRITQNSCCAKLKFRKSGIGQFCAKWLLRMIEQRKKNFAFRSAKIAQKFCEWKSYLINLMLISNFSLRVPTKTAEVRSELACSYSWLSREVEVNRAGANGGLPRRGGCCEITSWSIWTRKNFSFRERTGRVPCTAMV